MSVQIEIAKDKIAEFCRRNHIRRLALFGSVLRDDFDPESDIDVLVEFEPGVRVGLRFFRMEIELCEIMARIVCVIWAVVRKTEQSLFLLVTLIVSTMVAMMPFVCVAH